MFRLGRAQEYQVDSLYELGNLRDRVYRYYHNTCMVYQEDKSLGFHIG